MSANIRETFFRLDEYCRKEGFRGYDPYDGLNSRLFQAIPFIRDSRFMRLAWIQFFKWSLINFRHAAGIKKEFNPKALGLFLSGYCNLYSLIPDKEYLDLINFFAAEIRSAISKNWSGACWGYNFDWQSRAFFLPKYTPTVVSTVFVSSSLIDAYEITGNNKLLDLAVSSSRFIMNDLNRTFDEKGNFAFSYSPLDRSVVYNASLLGSRLLSRIYSITGEEELIKAAQRSVAFCTDKQDPDGSWSYGTESFHKWIDSFHTGYNIEAISDYINYSGDKSYEANLDKGFEYYINNFFTAEGVSKYYNNSVYPVDIHAPAQLIITLSRTGKLKEYKALADKVLDWTIIHMQSREGYFYYKKGRFFTSGIPYMRWAQAWMFLALSEYLKTFRNNSTSGPSGSM